MNITNDEQKLIAKLRHLKQMMVWMLVFTILGPSSGPIIYHQEPSQLQGVGIWVFYVGTPLIFASLFLVFLIAYRRVNKRLTMLNNVKK